jgi:hypothetical protein
MPCPGKWKCCIWQNENVPSEKAQMLYLGMREC